MTSKQPYARIAITLPEADLAAADRLAMQQDRSRSWIVAEAVRRYAASIDDEDKASGRLDGSRRAQLRHDLALTPEQRVREAEETQRLSVQVTRPQTFTSFDEFLSSRRASSARE